MRFCEPGDPQVDRVGQDQLEKLNNEAPLTSGELLAVHTRDEKNRPVNVTRATEADGPENQWVLFLTESSAREKHKPYRAHIRKRTAKTKTARVTEHAWADYLDELEGTGDQRTAEVEARSSTETTTPVTFTHAPKKGPERTLQLGHRHLASALLSPGQPVWVRTNKDRSEVHELRLSMLWRHLANTHTPDKRAGNFRACQDETSLCPSCQVFGSAQDLSEAGNGSAESEGARQHSYRGHVRFGDAHVEGAVAPMQVIVPPLGKPNPGSGQFYLVTDGTHRDNAAKKPPLREWGSIADAGTPRELRGRKYYWHTPTDSDKLPERAKKRDHHSAKMVSHAEAFPTGTQFTATLAFTDLSRAQLGGLLATLDPGPLLNADGLHQHVGGGRPLGYGSCQISIDGKDSQVWRSGARYGGAGDVESLSDPSELLSDFRRSALPRLRETWKLLAKALNPDSVDPDKGSYPPGASWARRGQLQFDRGFEFWKQTSGAELERDKNGSRAGYPLTPLPDLAQSDQELPIVPKATKKRLPNQQSPGGKRR